MTPSDQIAKQEQELAKAMLNSNVQQLDELISDDLIFTDHTGRLLDKAADLEAHRSGTLKIDTLESSGQLIKIFGNTAVVSVLVNIGGSYAAEHFKGTLRFTRVWMKRDDSWKVVAAHSVAVNS